MRTTKEHALSIISTALGGGINYWLSRYKTIRRDIDAWQELSPSEILLITVDGDRMELNVEKVLCAVDDMTEGRGPDVRAATTNLRYEVEGGPDTYGIGVDASVADVIVQIAVFGEVIYG